MSYKEGDFLLFRASLAILLSRNWVCFAGCRQRRQRRRCDDHHRVIRLPAVVAAFHH